MPSLDVSPMTEMKEAELLSFIYQLPMGIILAQSDGTIELMSAKASQLLLQINPTADFLNLVGLASDLSPFLADRLDDFVTNTDSVCASSNHSPFRVELHALNGTTLWLDVELVRVSDTHMMMSFSDSTILVEQDNARHQQEIQRAEALTKLEMATNIIHDIGNAVTGIAISTEKLNADKNWPELDSLAKLHQLIDAKCAELDQALGIGKGNALSTFVGSLHSSLSNRQKSFDTLHHGISVNVKHVQDIVQIQKSQVGDGEGISTNPIAVAESVDHALKVCAELIAQHKCQVSIDDKSNQATVMADKTRLTQVIVNLIKNSCEAMCDLEGKHQRSQANINLVIESDPQYVHLRVEDNGTGFSPDIAAKIGTGHFTTKPQGSGTGTLGATQFADSHGGTFSLGSEGAGLGCCAILSLPISPKGEHHE
ncbi:ATP-binding protein [Vibrio sp. WXL210]|uniref:ATP-binding protein n=1 Tax=Vibrio sp. WXL210 TaxID=3450709 RepID=UPI003EC5226E